MQYTTQKLLVRYITKFCQTSADLLQGMTVYQHIVKISTKLASTLNILQSDAESTLTS
jgi:hypothetical protein